MSWIDSILERTSNALRFKSVGIRSQSVAVRLLDTVPVELDLFFHADVSSANYIVLAETASGLKETLQINVIAGISEDRLSYQGRVAVYGRVNFGTPLLDINCVVDASKCSVQATPSVGEDVLVKIFPTYMETIYGG
jgi:hypothetical protein